MKAHCILVFDPVDAAGTAKLEALAREAALASRGRVLHIMMPTVPSTAEVRQFFGVESAQLPTAVWSDMRHADEENPQGKQLIWPTSRELSATSLIAWEDEGLAAGLGGGAKEPKKNKRRVSNEL